MRRMTAIEARAKKIEKNLKAQEKREAEAKKAGAKQQSNLEYKP